MSNTRNNHIIHPININQETLLNNRARLRKLRNFSQNKKTLIDNATLETTPYKNNSNNIAQHRVMNAPIILEDYEEKNRKRKRSTERQLDVNQNNGLIDFDIDGLDLNVELEVIDLNNIDLNLELEVKNQTQEIVQPYPPIYLDVELKKLPVKQKSQFIREVHTTIDEENTVLSFNDCLDDALRTSLNGHSLSYPFGNVVQYNVKTWAEDTDCIDHKGNMVRTSLRFFSDFVPINNYYFAVTTKVKDYAKYFLETLWENPSHLNLLHKSHKDKVKAFNKNNAFSQCISFMVCQIQDQDICYVAPSASSEEVLTMLNDHATKIFNYKKDIQYVVLKNESYAYQTMLIQVVNALNILNIKNISKGCAEKILIPTLLKLLAEDPDLYVDGVVNCSIVPFEYNKRYGIKAPKNSIESYYTPIPQDSPQIDLDNTGRYISCLPCCSECQKLKPAVLTILTAAYQFGLQQKNKEEKDLITSPIRNSYV